MVERRIPKARISVTGIDPESLPVHVLDTNQTFLELIRTARTKIIIMGYRFTEHGDDHFIEMLEEALKNGKRLYLLTDHIYGQNSHLRKFFAKMLRQHNGKFRLWTYEDNEDTIMHIKSMVIDNDRVYLGSANFSRRGITKNIELGAVIYDATTIKSVKSVFNWLTTKDERVTEVNVRELRT